MKKGYFEALTLRSAFTVLCLGFLGTAAQAQEHNQRCGTDQEHRRLKELHPEIAVYEQRLEAYIQRQLRGMDLRNFARTTGVMDTTFHVPVVVHIMHNYGGENISDNDVYRAVKELNDLYNKRNADTIDVIPTFKENIPGTNVRYIGNTNISFHLAQKDPQGRPTRGITRTRTQLAHNGGNQSKLIQWPPDMYLNIWVVGTFSEAHSRAGAYAYKPADAELIPYADGPIVAFYRTGMNINHDETLGHEVGHYFNLDHVWGGTNNPEVACGDDAVDDTPPTKGHAQPEGISDGCTVLSSIYDTECLHYHAVLGKPFLDIAHSRISSTSTTEGVTFNTPTAITLNSVRIYPSAALGSPFTIQLLQNGNPMAGYNVSGTVLTNNDTAQLVPLAWNIAKGSNYKLVFSQNPGMFKDSVYGNYPQEIPGAMVLSNETIDGRYNFFYTIDIGHGYFRIYDTTAAKGFGYPFGSEPTVLIDYPDTVNAQNVMDYTGCSKMFTHGQSLRMRAALNSPFAGRNKLFTTDNLFSTGITDGSGNILPVADLPPVADFSLATHFNSIGGDVMRSDRVYACNNTPAFSFTDRSWQDTITSRQWTFSNGASSPTSTAATVNNVSFSQPGWANIRLIAGSNAGSDTIERNALYIADGDNPLDAATYYQEFQSASENDRFPIFNYFNNQFKWSLVSNAGYYDNYSIRYRSFDDRVAPVASSKGAPVGDYDDFFTPPFNLQPLSSGNCNLNFMYSGAYRTANSAQMNDTFEVFMSIDCGQTWSLLKRISKGDIATVGTVNTEYTASAGYAGNDWKLMSINIPTANRVSKALFRFRYKPGVNSLNFDQGMTGTGNNFFVDRIHISTFPTGINGAEMNAHGFVVAPNPTHEGAKIILKGERNTLAQVVVTDVTGKVVFRTEKAVNGSMTVIDIPAQNIAVKGIYLVQVATGNNKHTEKLVVY